MLGADNPLPMLVGGGPTPASKTYATLRQAVGTGGSARDDSGIEGLWRRSEAKGLAAAHSAKRRAMLQANPSYATDFIPYYERLLGIVPGIDDNETQRRNAVVARWTERPIASWNELEDALQRIDPRFVLVNPDDTTSLVSDMGRVFDAHEPSDPKNGPQMGLVGGVSLLPAYSTRDVLRVSMPLGHAGGPTPTEAELIERAKRLLRGVLAPWVDFEITVNTWQADVVPADYGTTT